MFLLILWALQAVSVVFIYQFRLSKLQEQNQSLSHWNAENKDLSVVNFPSTEKIQWEKPGKELWYHGTLLDVVFVEYEKGNTRIYAWDDTEEQQLRKQFKRLASGCFKSPADAKNKLSQEPVDWEIGTIYTLEFTHPNCTVQRTSDVALLNISLKGPNPPPPEMAPA